MSNVTHIHIHEHVRPSIQRLVDSMITIAEFEDISREQNFEEKKLSAPYIETHIRMEKLPCRILIEPRNSSGACQRKRL
jgi:hypothetical protein